MLGRVQMRHSDDTYHYKLFINPTHDDDTGYYTALATGPHGTSACSALLIVHESVSSFFVKKLF